MTEDFYSVAIPEQRQILGLKLRPLSLGHLVILHRINSAFVCEGIPDYEELAIAALVCSLSYEDGIAALTDPKTADVMRLLGERITGLKEWGVRLGFRQARVIDLEANIKAFSDYIREGSRVPYYTYTPGDFKPMDCPAVQIVKVALMREMHFSESEILNRSWALCLWDHVTLKALSGQVSMVDKSEIDSAMAVGAKLAEMVKAGKLKPGGNS